MLKALKDYLVMKMYPINKVDVLLSSMSDRQPNALKYIGGFLDAIASLYLGYESK